MAAAAQPCSFIDPYSFSKPQIEYPIEHSLSFTSVQGASKRSRVDLQQRNYILPLDAILDHLHFVVCGLCRKIGNVEQNRLETLK